MFKYIISALLVFVLVVIIVFYFALRNVKRDISSYLPISSVLNKKLYVKDATVVYLSEEDSTIVLEDISPTSTKIQLELNDYFLFEKATMLTKSVSGIRYIFLEGKLVSKTGESNVVLNWGKNHFLCLEEPCDYWLFEKAPWQKEADSTKYFF